MISREPLAFIRVNQRPCERRVHSFKFESNTSAQREREGGKEEEREREVFDVPLN